MSRGDSTAGSTATAETTNAPAGVTIEGDTRQFGFEILSVESCGQTCRDVTVVLRNRGDAATDVAATSRLFAGQAGEDKVWEGTERIGDMPADSTERRTIRMKLSLLEAQTVCSAETVTLVTDVSSASNHQQFTSKPDIQC